MARRDCAGNQRFGQVRVQWRCPAEARSCSVEVWWMGQQIMVVTLDAAEPRRSFSVTTEESPHVSVRGEFHYGPGDGNLQMVYLESPDGTWADVQLCPGGPSPPPPPPPPEPGRPEVDVLGLDVESAGHDLFPYVFLRQWPGISPQARFDRFVDYPSAATPVPGSLYANLLAIDRKAPDARSLMITQGLDFLAGDPPYAGQRVTRSAPLEGLAGRIGVLWRPLRDALPMTVGALVAWLCRSLDCTWDTLVAEVRDPLFAAQVERAFENLFAQMLVPGYDRVGTEAMLQTLILAHLLGALVASLPPVPPGEPQPEPDPDAWPPTRITAMAEATVVLANTVYPLPPAEAPPAPPQQDAGAPVEPASIRPYAVGALQVVRRALLRYAPGELADIENVMPGEYKVRRHSETQVERTQETAHHAQDTGTQQATGGLATAFDAEARDVLDANYEIDYSVNYGPPEQGDATGYWKFRPIQPGSGEASTDPAQVETQRRTQWARTITQKAVQRLEQRVGWMRQTSREHHRHWSERHSFDRRQATTPLRGVYRWLDAIHQCWVAALGERLVLEVFVPEPARSYIAAERDLAGARLVEPILPSAIGIHDFTDIALDPASPKYYARLAAQYDYEQIETAPAERRTMSGTIPTGAALSSGGLPLPDGYVAESATVQLGASTAPMTVRGSVGTAAVTLTDAEPAQAVVLEPTTGPVPYVFVPAAAAPTDEVAPPAMFTVSIELGLRLDDAARSRWQATFYAGLMAAYRRQLAEYLKAAGEPVGRRQPNTLETRRTIRQELKRGGLKAFITALRQRTGADGRILRFLPALQEYLERALEWPEMSYGFLVTLADSVPAQHRRMGAGDASMTAFLEAAHARLLLPVQPGFERAIVLLLYAGIPWNGDPALTPAIDVPLAPDADTTTIDLLDDLKRMPERCSCERNQASIGAPWLVRTPTTLTILDEGSALPEFPARIRS